MARHEDYFLRPIYKSAAFWVAVLLAVAAIERGAQPLLLPFPGPGRAWLLVVSLLPAVAFVGAGVAFLIVQHAAVRKSLADREPSSAEAELLNAAFWSVQVFYVMCGALLLLSWALAAK